ncbi:MAG TPA: Asp23/Gls24 family envelope stress response protein [Clostridiales bacterium]|nr:Asp23/Gls24 family envelope stress response protein [Clostridiales bacterium]
MSENVQTAVEEYGKITFADEVVAIIAGLAATEVDGVAAMSGGFAGGFTEMLGMKNLSKGVKVEIGEKEAAIDLYIIVEYGVRVPEVAWKIQENVKKTVETMTGLDVVEVNIHVQGIDFEKQTKKDKNSNDPEKIEVEDPKS